MRSIAKPRVHWVSPIPDAQTDIAHYTNRILSAISDKTDLTLWTDSNKWDRSLEKFCTVRQLDPDTVTPNDFNQVNESGNPDAIFIQIGNSWVFHSGLLRLARRIPSIIVLHDLAIQELCFDAIYNRRFSAEAYMQDIIRWQGEAGLSTAQDVFDGKIKPIDMASKYPGFEITLDRAASVLVHTPAAYSAVSQIGIVPTYHLDLPFRSSTKVVSAKRARSGPLRFVQFGYIGPNRRLEQVLETLGALRHNIDFQFDIMGNVWDPEYVQSRIDSLGLSTRVTIHGFVSEALLDSYLAEAHLVFNLRFPTMGEASGSQLRIWNASAASVVTDLGWYGALPEGGVFKISLEHERADLHKLVQKLHVDREICESIGRAGRLRLESHHSPELYASGIAEIATQFADDASGSVLARSARRALSAGAGSSSIYSRALAKRL